MLLNNRNFPADAKRYAWQCVAFNLSLILILGGYKLPQARAEQTPTANYKIFTDWCTNKISNITHLTSLTNLTDLWLNDNKISDITPLKSLTKLTYLSLGGNPIANQTCPIKPESICNF